MMYSPLCYCTIYSTIPYTTLGVYYGIIPHTPIPLYHTDHGARDHLMKSHTAEYAHLTALT
eukprot:scaffold464_cov181-Amphora_coffeaeformis.AAC.24